MSGNVSLALFAVGLLIGATVLGVLFIEVRDTLEQDIEDCEAAGGEKTVYGELLYCEFDNGTGRALGTGEAPHELDDEGPDRWRPGLVMLFPIAAGCGVMAVGFGVVQRYRN